MRFVLLLVTRMKQQVTSFEAANSGYWRQSRAQCRERQLWATVVSSSRVLVPVRASPDVPVPSEQCCAREFCCVTFIVERASPAPSVVRGACGAVLRSCCSLARNVCPKGLATVYFKDPSMVHPIAAEILERFP